jgi:hypothetical protein
VVFEEGLEVSFEVLDVEGEFVISSAEIVFVLGVVTDDTDDVSVTDSDTVVEVDLFGFEGFLSVEDDFFEDEGFVGFDVTDDFDVAVVGIEGLGDDFSFGIEVDFGDVGLGLRGFLSHCEKER